MPQSKPVLKSEIAPNGDGTYSPVAIEIMGKVQKFTQDLLEEYSDRLSPHSIHYLLMDSCAMPVTFFLIDEITNEAKP